MKIYNNRYHVSILFALTILLTTGIRTQNSRASDKNISEETSSVSKSKISKSDTSMDKHDYEDSKTKKSTPSSSSSEKKIPNRWNSTNEEIMDYIGLHIKDYNDEGVRLRQSINMTKKEFTNTYANLTVQTLNEVFSDTNISAQEIIKKLGPPDHVTVGHKIETVTLEYKVSQDAKIYEFEISWPIGENDSEFYKHVKGKPVDASPNYPYYQTIVSDGKFEAAVYDK
ncbi:hypothetical protein JEQ21_09075 [Streptococcus sp. 121]|uniref:hypothetical protein n=1 Tax=Streptococcus sp. 121 TaxID=2797637 RepID=UPI0018F10850|nr:hypothetical protein [Streptococcus sp. 121]MBJ6746589.1 hypothetical protein [Streptococcus sp. 121]